MEPKKSFKNQTISADAAKARLASVHGEVSASCCQVFRMLKGRSNNWFPVY